jgi:SOS-response transcriptional repressor LexA
VQFYIIQGGFYMETIGKRLKHLRDLHSFTQQEVSQGTGIVRANIGKYESDKIKPSADTLISYSSFFNVSSDWILTGEGHGPDSKESVRTRKFESKPVLWMGSREEKLVEKLRGLSTDDIEELELLIDFKSERTCRQTAPVPVHIREAAVRYQEQPSIERIPLLGQVAAGSPIWAEAEYMELIPVPANSNKIDYALVVRGDSMEPDFQNGSVLFAHKQPTLENGEIGIILLEDSVTCKVFYRFEDRIELHSLNKKYKPIVVLDTDHMNVTVLGKVMKTGAS